MSITNLKKNAILDCRVSGTKQLQGDSLEDQEKAGRITADKLQARVVQVFRKPQSATKTEREDLDEIVEYIRRSPVPIHYYIFKCIDRFTRAGYGEYIRRKSTLEKLHVQVIDSYGIIQPKRNTLGHIEGDFQYSWSMHSPSEIGEMFAAYAGQQEGRDIATRMIGAEIRLVQDGYAVRRAPDGLKNKSVLVGGKKKVVREISERAHYFQKMFELRAAGMDDMKIVELLNAMGFKTSTYRRWDRTNKEEPREIGQKGGKQLTVKQLQRFIQKTEYAGISYEKWNKHRPVKMQQFEGLVSIEVFNKANRGKVHLIVNTDQSVEVLHNYTPWGKIKRLRDNPKYPWKCILCPICKSEMLASHSRGKSGKKYGAYHCGGGKSGKRSHVFFRIAQQEFEKTVAAYLDSLRFEQGFSAGLELHLVDQYREREKEILGASSRISHSVGDLKTQLANKLEAFSHAETATVRRMLEEEIQRIEENIKQTESQRGRIEITEKSIRSFRHYVDQLMEHPSEILTNAEDLFARRMLLSLFFEETPTYTEILNGTPKLTSLFKLSEEFKRNENQLVTLPGIEPGFSA
jgi:site-specific DNA recombinase